MYFQKHSLNTRISIHSKVLLTDSIFETGAKVTVGMFTNYRLQIFILAMAPIAIKPFLWGKITSKIVYFKAWNINRFFLFLQIETDFRPLKALWAYLEMLKWPQLQLNPHSAWQNNFKNCHFHRIYFYFTIQAWVETCLPL